MANGKQRGGARAGAGRPTKAPEKLSVPITLTLPPELVDRLSELAEARGTTRSGLIQDMLRKARLPKPKS